MFSMFWSNRKRTFSRFLSPRRAAFPQNEARFCRLPPSKSSDSNLAFRPSRTRPALQSTAMPTAVRSHAKINLGLYIGAPRPDGFHSLVTVYQTLELHDVVSVAAMPAPDTSIRLTSNDERVPTDARNTAWKMVA